MNGSETGVLRTSLMGFGLASSLMCWSLSGAAMARENPAMATDLSSVHRGGGAHAGGGGHPHPNAGSHKAGNVRRGANVNRNAANVKRNNVNVHKNVNVNVNRTRVVARPVRGWVPRPYYGTIVGGIALGTVIAATAVGVAPAPPAANMCWFWSDSAMSQGYWDYCVAP